MSIFAEKMYYVICVILSIPEIFFFISRKTIAGKIITFAVSIAIMIGILFLMDACFPV